MLCMTLHRGYAIVAEIKWRTKGRKTLASQVIKRKVVLESSFSATFYISLQNFIFHIGVFLFRCLFFFRQAKRVQSRLMHEENCLLRQQNICKTSGGTSNSIAISPCHSVLLPLWFNSCTVWFNREICAFLLSGQPQCKTKQRNTKFVEANRVQCVCAANGFLFRWCFAKPEMHWIQNKYNNWAGVSLFALVWVCIPQGDRKVQNVKMH